MINALQNISGTVTIQTPPACYPFQTSLEKIQFSARTLGGELYIYDRSVVIQGYSVIIKKITAALRDDIISFFDTETNGPQKEFKWFDHLAVAHTVSLDGKIDMVPTGPVYYTITIPIKDVS